MSRGFCSSRQISINIHHCLAKLKGFNTTLWQLSWQLVSWSLTSVFSTNMAMSEKSDSWHVGQQVVKVIWQHAALPPHMDGSMVLRAHWRHLANMTEFVLPLAHPSPQSKWQINQLSRSSCTAHGRRSLYLQWALLSPKIVHSQWEDLTHDSLGLPRVHNPNCTLIG